MSDPATLDFATIAELAPLIEARALSPVELTEALLKRIERYEPKLHAFVALTAEHAMAAAQRAEQQITAGG